MLSLCKDLVLPFFLNIVLAVITVLIVRADVLILENGLSETSITEITQQSLLFIAVLIFAFTAKRQQQQRAFFVLVTGFLGSMLLREMDFYFDMILHGFWIYPTTALALSCCFYAFKHPENLASSATLFKQSRAYFNLLIGLTIILIFSRLFGSGSLWKEIMLDDYQHLYKTIIQEGLELFGYTFIFLAAAYQKTGASRGSTEEE